MSKPFRLSVETLEARTVPAVWFNPWPEPSKLTLSFAPDGTNVSSSQSSLFSSLNSNFGSQTWKSDVLKAFQTWASLGNVDLSLVNDAGRAFGQLGPFQGSPFHGDFRVGARPLSPSELAVATPFDSLSDWSGDVILNSNYSFTRGANNQAYDLFTVMLQEAGHTFGLPNSVDATSAMFTTYSGVRTGLTASDIVNFQSMYGVRSADRFEGPTGNNSLAKASSVRFAFDESQWKISDPSSGAIPFLVKGDMTTAADRDFYKVQLPSGEKDFWVVLRTSNISLFTGTVRVMNSSGVTVTSQTVIDPLNGDVQLFYSAPQPGGTYYVSVDAAPTAGVFGIGSYHLAIGKEAQKVAYPGSNGAFWNDDELNGEDEDSNEVVTLLDSKTTSLNNQWDYSFRASVSKQFDNDYYRIQAPVSTSPQTLVATVWATENLNLNPNIVITANSQFGTPVAAQILRNDSGFITVQVTDVAPATVFYLKVGAFDHGSSSALGNYIVATDFRSSPLPMNNFVQGDINRNNVEVHHAIDSTKTHLVHFLLNAERTQGSSEIYVKMTIYNRSQQPIFTLTAREGESVSASILLQPGRYTLRMASRTIVGNQIAQGAKYDLRGIFRSDPIGPKLVDPLASPTGGSTSSPPPTNPPTEPPPYDYWFWTYNGRLAWIDPNT